MSDKKSTLTLSDLLSRDVPYDGSNRGSPTLTSPLGGREDIEKRTRFMRGESTNGAGPRRKDGNE